VVHHAGVGGGLGSFLLWLLSWIPSTKAAQ
jgi:hypothetical protein